jgi:uncharacterized damage-inducible protein DinB
MTGSPQRPSPDVDPDLLLAHLEYAAWAADKTLSMVDKLPAQAVTEPVVSSFPSILATLQHIFLWDKYYLVYLRGGCVEPKDVDVPATYEELREEWRRVHKEMLSWAREELAERKDDVLTGWGVWPVWMIVMQIANHATYHRGQILTLLRQAGYAPERGEWSDLILYYLGRYPQANQKEWLQGIFRKAGADAFGKAR